MFAVVPFRRSQEFVNFREHPRTTASAGYPRDARARARALRKVIVVQRARRRWTRYWVVALVVVAAYGATVAPMWWTRGWDNDGPLSLHQPALKEPLPGGASLKKIHQRCWEDDDATPAPASKIVGGRVGDQLYYACYDVERDGYILFAVVWTLDGSHEVTDASVIKEGGAWRWIGLVKTPGELWLGAAAVFSICAYGFAYYFTARPGPPSTPNRWQ